MGSIGLGGTVDPLRARADPPRWYAVTAIRGYVARQLLRDGAAIGGTDRPSPGIRCPTIASADSRSMLVSASAVDDAGRHGAPPASSSRSRARESSRPRRGSEPIRLAILAAADLGACSVSGTSRPSVTPALSIGRVTVNTAPSRSVRFSAARFHRWSSRDCERAKPLPGSVPSWSSCFPLDEAIEDVRKNRDRFPCPVVRDRGGSSA